MIVSLQSIVTRFSFSLSSFSVLIYSSLTLSSIVEWPLEATSSLDSVGESGLDGVVIFIDYVVSLNLAFSFIILHT